MDAVTWISSWPKRPSVRVSPPRRFTSARDEIYEVLERLVGHLRLVGPRVAEDAGQAFRVGGLDRAEGRDKGTADVTRGIAHVGPVRALGDSETVVCRCARVEPGGQGEVRSDVDAAPAAATDASALETRSRVRGSSERCNLG
jgi:hypothetical protein